MTKSCRSSRGGSWIFSIAILGALVGATVCLTRGATESVQHSSTQNPADDGQWLMPAKDYASTRYSALDEINASNVKSLKLAWTFSTGLLRGHEAAPIVVDNTMYIVTPYPNTL